MDIVDHLFRREAGKMIATVARIFGLENLALAEDVVQDAFCRALETWKQKGIPPNPEAWLMATAKNRALDAIRREKTARKFAPELVSEWSLAATVAERFEPHQIQDDQLRMMLACADPRLKEEYRVPLVLNLLCGFSVGETAAAFLVSHAAMEKRLTRAKHMLAECRLLLDFGDAEFAERLSSVHRSLYLLFNEGYHSASPDFAVRQELCSEAMRLIGIVAEHPKGAIPETFALAALTHLLAARLPARLDASGDFVTLFDQDRSTWDRSLLAEGFRLLERSAFGAEVSDLHLEAMIAAEHAKAQDARDTDWQAIVGYYDHLLGRNPGPVIVLNRAIALAELDGPQSGLLELARIEGEERLVAYPFYWAARAELQLRSGRSEAAAEDFARARDVARNPAERRFLAKRIEVCHRSAPTPES